MPKVAFQIVPFSAGPHPGIAGPFTILGFASAADRDIVYLEHSTGNVYLDQPEQLAHYSAKFERLQGTALSPHQSKQVLSQLRRSCDR